MNKVQCFLVNFVITEAVYRSRITIKEACNNLAEYVTAMYGARITHW
jgi:hypothetical protein